MTEERDGGRRRFLAPVPAKLVPRLPLPRRERSRPGGGLSTSPQGAAEPSGVALLAPREAAGPPEMLPQNLAAEPLAPPLRVAPPSSRRAIQTPAPPRDTADHAPSRHDRRQERGQPGKDQRRGAASPAVAVLPGASVAAENRRIVFVGKDGKIIESNHSLTGNLYIHVARHCWDNCLGYEELDTLPSVVDRGALGPGRLAVETLGLYKLHGGSSNRDRLEPWRSHQACDALPNHGGWLLTATVWNYKKRQYNEVEKLLGRATEGAGAV